jgi:Sensors of blue-light using FAD
MTKLYRIAYCSRSCMTGVPAHVETQIRRILAAARTNNQKANLTGALTFNESYFAQVLEGAADDLMALMQRINRDARHSHLQVLERAEITTRSFPQWSMAYVAKSDGDGRHPLAHFEFEEALTKGATPEAKKLLNALRRVVVGKIEAPKSEVHNQA